MRDVPTSNRRALREHAPTRRRDPTPGGDVLTVVCAVAALLVSGAALLLTLRTTNARVARDVAEIESGLMRAQKQTADLEEAFRAHRTSTGNLVDEALGALETAEKKRRKATAERTRAEQAEPDRGGACVHGQQPELCLECAKGRFRSEGHAV